MKAIELSEYCGIDCLKIIDVEKPRPGANEILLEVRAAGINFAEMELTKGNTRSLRTRRSLWASKLPELWLRLARKSKTLRSVTRLPPLFPAAATLNTQRQMQIWPSRSPQRSPLPKRPQSLFKGFRPTLF